VSFAPTIDTGAREADRLRANGNNEQIGTSMARKRYQQGSIKQSGDYWVGRWREDVIEAE
jgi:hypothetical protein